MMARRESRLPRILPAGSVRKVTLGISVETDIRLAIWAKKRGVTRSQLAEEILARELPGVTVGGPGQAPAKTAAVA
jgi:hypothetical protein